MTTARKAFEDWQRAIDNDEGYQRLMADSDSHWWRQQDNELQQQTVSASGQTGENK